jgi:uncharacterized protein DUF4058
MPSPFPGMNPYLEQNDSSEDFHTNFLTRAQEILSGKVGDKYLVKIEVRLILHELSAEERRFMGRGDVAVTSGDAAGEKPTATETLTAPVLLQLPAVEVERHVSLEIRDRRNRRVVTVVELLSPSNKAPGRIETTIWQSVDRSWPGRPTSWKSTCVAAACGRAHPNCRLAPTTPWLAGMRIDPRWVSGRSACAMRCRSCLSRSMLPIRRWPSI